MKEIKKLINNELLNLLLEEKGYQNNVVIKSQSSDDDYDEEVEEVETKLDIINSYFPFESVEGVYDLESGVDLKFDNGIEIHGKYNNEPFIIDFIVNGKKYEFDIHPFGGLGELDVKKFTDGIEAIYEQENVISLVISNNGYGLKSLIINNKSLLDDYEIVLVDGIQYEGKQLGDTKYGERPYKTYTQKNIK